MNKAERSRLYADFLKGEGYSPEVDNDGDLHFKYEGRTYFILIQDNDPGFFRLVLPGIWSIDDEQERAAVEHACVVATATTKVAKVFPVETRVWGSVELFISPPEQFKAVFTRSLQALGSCVQRFASEMYAWRATR